MHQELSMYLSCNTEMNCPQMHNYTLKNNYDMNRVHKLYRRVATHMNCNKEGILQRIIIIIR